MLLGNLWRDANENIAQPTLAAYCAVKFNVEMQPEVAMKTQERAYTSPIGYTLK